jgi:hypothetical protein
MLGGMFVVADGVRWILAFVVGMFWDGLPPPQPGLHAWCDEQYQ